MEYGQINILERIFLQEIGGGQPAINQLVRINNAIDRQRKFLKRFGDTPIHGLSMKYQEKRVQAFYDYFNDGNSFIGEGLKLVGGAKILRDHIIEPLGKIEIGERLTMYSDAYIDYTADVKIGDDVVLSENVLIYTHDHDMSVQFETHNWSTLSTVIPKKLEIGDGVWIGARSVVLPSCNSIGRGANIGAVSVVRGNVPPYAIVAGNPAKVIGFRLTPQEVLDFEEKIYPEAERLPLDLLEKNYDKYFIKRIKEIKEFTRL